MAPNNSDFFDVVVVGAGPAGVVAALRAARLGARTALLTRDEFGGMGANDGPIPVRTLAHAARLFREARQLPDYGITSGTPSLHYPTLLGRVAEVTELVRTRSFLREDLDNAGVTIHERCGPARFTDSHELATSSGLRLEAQKAILCTGGASRPLAVPGFELTCTHSDAWGLSSVPESMIVVGAGATGVQVASIFNAFGSRLTLLEVAPSILATEDGDVAATMREALETSGIDVREDVGGIERFETCSSGVRVVCAKYGASEPIDATLAVVAIGWVANTAELNLAAAGVGTTERGYVDVDPHLRTSAPHIFAAGDATGRLMVVHEAMREGYVAATNAVLDSAAPITPVPSPIGSFTDPEYASVGLSEASARQAHDVLVVTEPFDRLPRPLIDGRPVGFCKLIVDREQQRVLGCHIVGERAVELAQLGAVAIASGMTIDELALVPFSFPTYANALGRAAVTAARELLGTRIGIEPFDVAPDRTSDA